MADTTKATAARKAKAVIKSRYGDFIPEGSDPENYYRLVAANIFGRVDKVEPSVLLFALNTAKQAGINPLIPRQIYAIEIGGKWQIVVGAEGMVTIAENTGQYGGVSIPRYGQDDDGSEWCEIDIIKVVDGLVITGGTKVYKSEYSTGKNLWASKPKTMLKKVALVHALRQSFSACAGLYISEEVENTGATPKTSADIGESRLKAIAEASRH